MENPKKSLETFTVYKPNGTGRAKEEVRNAEELTTDEYYEYIEEDRIVPSVNGDE